MSTALGAEDANKVIFISEAHEKFYYEKLKEVRCQDVYHKALIYCLGICNDTRNDIKWFEKILRRHPNIEVQEFSDFYTNKGTNRFYRVYVEVQKSVKNGK